MPYSLKAKLVRIGNSRGIRIPKAVVEQLGLDGDISLEVRADALLIRPAKATRIGWEEQFGEMAASGEDRLVDGDLPAQSSWDEAEWTW